jgi:hypothetical protein
VWHKALFCKKRLPGLPSRAAEDLKLLRVRVDITSKTALNKCYHKGRQSQFENYRISDREERSVRENVR